MKIREAVIDDLKDIQELNLLLFEEEYEWDKSLDLGWTFGEKGSAYFKSTIHKVSSCAYVAVSEGVVCSYIVGSEVKVEGYRGALRVSEIGDMFVLPEYRAIGIGTALVASFIAWSKERGIDQLKVQVTSQNKKAIGFYKKMGLLEGTVILEKTVC